MTTKLKTEAARFDVRTFEARSREIVEAALPGVRGAPDLERARILRSWVHQITPLAGPGASFEDANSNGIAYEPSYVLLPAIARRQAGFLCAGTSYVLRALYRLFDLDSFAYNMGLLRHELSHCVTLVRIEEKGTRRVIVQDAHFNAETLLDGEPASVASILDALARRQDDRITLSQQDGPSRAGLVRAEHEDEVRAEWTECYEGKRLGEVGGIVTYDLRFSLDRFRYKHLYEAELLRSFATTNPTALMLLPLGTSGEREAETIAARARLAADARLRPVSLAARDRTAGRRR